jgi:hypothetical protein
MAMARCDAFGEISNDAGQSRSIGGRHKASRVSAWLNTDNGQGSNCSLRVSAEVLGEGQAGGRPRKTCAGCGHKFAGEVYEIKVCPVCKKPRQGRDTRKSVFTVELPESKWNPDACEVEIVSHGDRFRGILHVGALLCALKGATEIASGSNPQHGKECLEFSKETAKFLADSLQDIPDVNLPGGVSLRYALGCVQMVEAIADGKVQKAS